MTILPHRALWPPRHRSRRTARPTPLEVTLTTVAVAPNTMMMLLSSMKVPIKVKLCRRVE